MRIVIVSQHFWPSVGGAQSMLDRLASCWMRSGCNVTVLTCRWDQAWPEWESRNGYLILRRPVSRIRIWGTIRYIGDLVGWLRKNVSAGDVVYVSMLKHAAFAALGALRNRGAAVVLRAEGAGATGDVAWQDSARFGVRIRRRCQSASAIVAPARVIQDELFQAGYPSNIVRLIENGVPIPDPPWSPGEVVEQRKRLGLAEARTICYAGRIDQAKGIADLIKALPLISSGGAARLLIVGEGPDRPALEAAAASTGVADRVMWVGNVDDVEPYLRASDAFVLPSYQEGLSVALLEALALGIPSVASDIPANRGMAAAEALPLVPARDRSKLAAAISQRLEFVDQSLLDKTRRDIAEKFALERKAAEHLSLFRELRAAQLLNDGVA